MASDRLDAQEFQRTGGLFGTSQTQTQKLLISFGSSAATKAALMNLLLNGLSQNGMAPFTQRSRPPAALLQQYRGLLDKPLSAWSDSERADLERTFSVQEGELDVVNEAQVHAAAEAANAENLKMILQSLGTLQ